MRICIYNARMLPPEAVIEDLMMQARKIKYDVIGLTETRQRPPLNGVYGTGEELFTGRNSRGAGGVCVLGNTSMEKNIDTFEQLTIRIGRLRIRRHSATSALTIFVFSPLYAGRGSHSVEGTVMKLTTSSSVKGFA